ncbi:MAG: BC1872 family protein [Burkholderiales bacterium]
MRSNPFSPSHQLDILVAEKVMGYTGIEKHEDGSWFGTSSRGNHRRLPHYSSDLNVAWQVLEKLAAKHAVQVDNLGYKRLSDGAAIPLWRCFIDWSPDSVTDNYAEGYTAAVAICRAALKACGVREI